MFSRHLRLALLLLLLAACARTPQSTTPAANQYGDSILRQIATAQDERNPAALLPFLGSPNAEYRQAAALAMASVQEKTATPFLLPLLHDDQGTVRRAAAYALGQTGDSTAVEQLAHSLMLLGGLPEGRALFEALGRCVTPHSLPLLWRIKALPPSPDTLLSTGLAWGIYRATLRGLATPEAVRRTVPLLAARQPQAARLGAAATLARVRGLDSVLAQVALPVLLPALAGDASFAVRANCATALGRIARPKAAAALQRAATHDADARVRVAAIRALPFDAAGYTGSRAAVFAALADSRPGVSLTAAEWLLAHAKGETGADLAARAEKLSAWRPRAVLLAAAVKAASPASQPSIGAIIKRRYDTAVTPYEKGYLLQALGEAADAFTILEDETFAAGQNPIVAGYGLTALLALRRRLEFPAARQAAFAAAMRRALASGDLNQLSIAAEALADKKLYPSFQPEDLAALRTAQAKLLLPRDIEAWQGIQTALDQLEGQARPTPAPIGTATQHPIDWNVVQGIAQNQPVRIRTTQGDIVLALKVNEAPGSVASFVTLLRQGFYNGLAFHRVIPNFVAQGGDPRGDGSGSAPYTLRSEFGDLRYGTGSVGLASAGKDTESCQFFFTLAPTPHLDGRYTIFAEVVQGLEVLPKLEIGDRLLSVELQ